MHLIIKFILKALSIEQASLVKVTPTANNGFTELVTLHKEKVLHIITVECVFTLCCRKLEVAIQFVGLCFKK